MVPDIRCALIPLLGLLVGSVTALAAGVAEAPQQDIVAVEAHVPLSESEAPGLADGAGLVDRIRGIGQILSAGVADAARQELRAAIGQIEALRRDAPEGLPASYRAAGDLWLPVRGDRARVRLDAPDVVPRPPRRGGDASDTLIAGAVLADWLPLEGTRTLLDAALRQLDGEQEGQARAGEFVAAALAGIRQTTRFTDPDSLDAYYAVEAALAAGDTWPPDVREGLRRVADRLAARDSEDKLAGQLRTVANSFTPETGPLLDAARALRTRIEASADSSTGQRPAPAAPGDDFDDAQGTGAMPTPGGNA
jgi:hypothetical protein